MAAGRELCFFSVGLLSFLFFTFSFFTCSHTKDDGGTLLRESHKMYKILVTAKFDDVEQETIMRKASDYIVSITTKKDGTR